VGEGSPYLTAFGGDDDAKTRCVTLYENRRVKPAHYEAVCLKHAVGPSRLRTIFPLGDSLMQSIQASQIGTGNKKRKASGSTRKPKARRRSKKNVVEEEASPADEEDTSQDELSVTSPGDNGDIDGKDDEEHES
jgi:hypothetical protein